MAEQKIRCVLHGSFRKHFDEIKRVANTFSAAGIQVIAPEISEITGITDGFVHLQTDASKDARLVELLYLQKVAELGREGFSYYVNPEGTIGTSASYELGIDQLTNTRYLFMEKLSDHPAYVPGNSIWKPDSLADYILANGCYPLPVVQQNELEIHRMTH